MSLQDTTKNEYDIQRLVTEYDRRKTDRSFDYQYSLFNPSHHFAIQSRQRNLLKILSENGFTELNERKVLEIGCGSGGVLREFFALGCNPKRLFGVELLPYRCIEAKENLPWDNIIQSDGRFLPYGDDCFDIVLQFTMFTSILDADIKRTIASEMLRVLKPDGAIIWYDFWLNPTNPQTKGIRLQEIRNLFPDCKITANRITLAPPIARRLAKYSWLLCEILESVKIFNTHYIGLIKPH